MEFRCPACDTSYRVPVRIDQQVRCARCNHVWRVSEQDFVIEDAERDDGEMPEAFASPGANDERDDGGQDSLSALLEDRQNWPAAARDDHEDSAAAPASRGWVDDAAQSADYPGRQAISEQLWEDDQPKISESGDSGAPGAEPDDMSAELDSLDKQIADGWFASAQDEVSEDDQQSGVESHAAFERNMERSEEVIAENSGDDESPRDQRPQPEPAANPLHALMSGESASTFEEAGREPSQFAQPGNEGTQDPWGGKVVRLSAPGAGHRLENLAREIDASREVASDGRQGAESEAPMAELIDKIAAGRAEPDGFAEPDSASHAEDDPAEFDDQAEKQREEEMGQAHFDSLQADMEDAAHSHPQNAQSYRSDAADDWSEDPYSVEAHEEAQRNSLAFGSGEEAFDDRAGVFEEQGDADEDWRDRRADMRSERAAAERRDERPQQEALEQDADDDALLAEYDFGDDDPAEIPSEMAEQPRRGAGTLTVAAAWALFLTVLAAAGVSAISFRGQVADALPASAPVYAAIGFPVDKPPLVFGEVGYSWDDAAGNTLTLNGQVTNTRSELIEVPNLQITARDENGAVLVEDSQFLGESALLAGETFEFRVRVEVSPEKLKTVELRF